MTLAVLLAVTLTVLAPTAVMAVPLPNPVHHLL